MLLRIPQVLSPAQVAYCRERLLAADWVDGRITAGHQGAQVKANHQLSEGSALAAELGELVLRALEMNPLFISATLPARVYPPLFNRYDKDEHFGSHIDNALRLLPGGQRIRTDVSATLFLTDPLMYEGGELLIEDVYGVQTIKLPAGDLIIYPATSVHRVTPVSQGTRLASFFWIQSMVRDDAQRALLFDLDRSIQRLHQTGADANACLWLTGGYHNLLRMWAEP
jgi:PKHD-type hydroxylase